MPVSPDERMLQMNSARIAGLVAAGMAGALLAGCRVETDKHGDGKDVKISTPFGGLQVKTNDANVLESIGLPAYPGAEVLKKDDDDGAADVNMSFGSFQLRVKASSYRTDDSPEKVEAFYRSGMKRFGDVIACRDDRVVGTPVRTFEGLTCDDQKEGHIMVQDDPSKHKLELKAGSKQHQHIVEIDGDGGGTKIGLVALDLPGKMDSDGEGGKGTQ
jgi:hypothetical protein